MRIQLTPWLRAALALTVALGLVGCGISEDEMRRRLDAQQARYQAKYDQDLGAEKTAHDKTRDALEKAAKRIAKLEEEVQQLGIELNKRGVNMEELRKRLSAEGSQNQELTERLERMQKALAEAKQREEQLQRIKERFALLQEKLKALTELGLKVEIRNNRMVIRLPGDVLFASGDVELQKKGKDVILDVAEVIRKDEGLAKRYFQIAGHTDDRPLKGGPYKDNWGLSVMRARSVLTYLISPTDARGGGGGLNPQFLHAAGYGDTDPVAGNDTDEGRQQNRRVELVVMPNVEEMLDLKSLL